MAQSPKIPLWPMFYYQAHLFNNGEMPSTIKRSIVNEMDGAVVGGGDRNHWWWALASASQLGWGIRSFAKGYAGDSRFMPLKAFAVASLFVGAAASASFGVLQAHGIHKVEDVMQVGADIRARLGLPPRAQDKSST